MEGGNLARTVCTAVIGGATALLVFGRLLRLLLGTSRRMKMQGKHCLVTGGSSGIGKEVAKVRSTSSRTSVTGCSTQCQVHCHYLASTPSASPVTTVVPFQLRVKNLATVTSKCDSLWSSLSMFSVYTPQFPMEYEYCSYRKILLLTSTMYFLPNTGYLVRPEYVHMVSHTMPKLPYR